LSGDSGDHVEVAVVVQHGRAVPFCDAGNHQVHDRQRPPVPGVDQQDLDLGGAVPDIVECGEPVEASKLIADLLGVALGGGRVEDLQLNGAQIANRQATVGESVEERPPLAPLDPCGRG
jgi:hypothetical protein